MTACKDILVITGDPSKPDPTKREASYHEEDRLTHDAMREAFRSLEDYRFRFLEDHDALLDGLRRDPPDLVVNFCDTGWGNRPEREIHLPAYLELLDIPYTGAGPGAMLLCYDKQIVRLLADSLGVPVPREWFIPAHGNKGGNDGGDSALPDHYPALLKPNTADGSVGITKDSVVHDRQQARDYLQWLRETLPGRDVLVQEYLPGPEYGIGLVGNPAAGFTVLPALEIDFSRLPEGLAPILSYESKALPDSPYWTDIGLQRADLPAALEQEMADQAMRLFARLGLRDYGRFDFRTGADGRIKLMEVNPNPAWANDAKLAAMAGFAEMEYPALLQQILLAAQTRLSDAG